MTPTVEVFTHNFKVTNYDHAFYQLLKEYCRPLLQMDMVPGAGGRYRPVVKKVFAASPASRKEMRFCISKLEDFWIWFGARGWDKSRFTVYSHELYTPAQLVSKFFPHWEPRDYQIPVIDFCAAPNEPIRVVVVQTGKGKANSVNSLVKVPGGWKRMGDILVGDVVTAWDGSATRVNGVFPQGRVETFKVTFADGRSTVVTGEHLWKIFYTNTTLARRWRIADTKEISRILSFDSRLYVPLCEPEDGEHKDFVIDPYLMGVLLGDGGMSTNTIVIRKGDQELFDNIAPLLPHGDALVPSSSDHCLGYRIHGTGGKNSTVTALRELGLLGSAAWDKEIPAEYLNASLDQRWALLQGLMDTDGTVNTIKTGGAISYCSTSEKLALGVQYLVRSLGGIAKISSRIPNYTHNGTKKEGRKAYNVLIRMKTPDKIFRLTRKKERTNNDNQYAGNLKLRIVSVEPNGFEEAQCISIEHPDHLYVTDDFIVTHNTLISAKAAEKLQHRTAVIVPAMYVEKWYDELKTMYVDVEKRMLMVRGVKQLFGLVTMAKLGQLDHDFLLISATSMQMYLSAWEKEPEYIEERSCKPEEFFKILGVGTKIIDELHKGIHLNVKMDLYTHIPKGLYLTATIKASNPFVNRMTEMAYPLAHRYQGLAYDRYIGVVAMEYRLNNPKALRWLGKRKQYSQTTFEASILRTNRILENYTRMIVELVKDTYLDVREKGQTCLVFAGSIDMCTHLTKALRKAYPKETIGRYVKDDPYSNLMENDIVVSTILSAGTAIDKYGLLTVLMTIGVDSIQANEQTMGRLRRLKDWPDTTPMFFYLVCADIKQHVKYHRSKVELLKDKALYQRYEIIPYRI